MPRCLPMLASFFDRFLMGFCSQLRPPEPQKSSPRYSESTIFQKIAIRKLHGIFIDFGANMPPFSLQKSTKIAPKIDLGRHHFLIDFCTDFLSILARFWKPTWGHVGDIFAQNGGGAVGRHPLFCWVYVIFGFVGPPGPLLGPFWVDFGRGWGSILEVFWYPCIL